MVWIVPCNNSEPLRIAEETFTKACLIWLEIKDSAKPNLGEYIFSLCVWFDNPQAEMKPKLLSQTYGWQERCVS